MSPLDGQEVQASPEATTPEPEKPEAVNLDARKDEFRKKVAGAQQLIEDIKNIYVDEDEGIDQKADANDAAVNELYTKLNTGLGTITSKFETESAKDENNTAEKLQALDAQLVGEVLTTIGVNQPATDKTLDAGIKEKTVEAAQVKDVAALEKNIKDYGVEHQKDIDAFKHAEFTFTSLQNTFELIKIAYPDKTGLDKIQTILTAFKDNSDYQKGAKGEALDPTALDTATAKLKSDFSKTAKEITGDDEEAMKDKIMDAIKKRFETTSNEWGKALIRDKTLTLTSADLQKIVPISVDGLDLQMTFTIEESSDKKTTDIVMNLGQTSSSKTYTSNDAFLADHPFLPVPADGKSITIDRSIAMPQFGPFLQFGISELSFKETVSKEGGNVIFKRSDIKYTDADGKPVELRISINKPISSLNASDLNWNDLDSGETPSSTEEAVTKETAESDRNIPEESRKFAEGLLGNKNGSVTLDGGKVLGPEKMTEYGISDASGYQIASRLEQNDASGEAYLVMNYENAVLKQEFTDEAAFKKKYPEISLPEKGGTSTANEVRFLSPAKPAPFGGIRRQRELEISVAQDGKISVKISNIMFGDPPKSEVHVPLRKHINDVKKVEDILYPSGYTREEGSNGTESDGSERGAEAGEELKSLEEYETMVSEYEKAYREMVKIEPGDPRLNELPKFLRDGFVFMQKSGIETFIKQAKGNIDDARTLDATSSKYNDKLLLIRDTTDEIAKYKDFMGDQNHSTLENLPEFKQIREGLTYGEDGYRPNLFEKHFKDAADVLDTHFYNRDKGHTGPYVEIVNAKMSSSQALHQLHGHFDVRVKGQYGDQPVRYEFKMMDTKNFTFEEAVANAMRKMVKDEDINKKIDEQKEKLDDKNETIDRVDRREARHLERRLRKMERLHEKHADWNDLRKAIKEDSIINKTADYEAKSEEDIRAEIIKDLGNPDDYEYFNFGDKFAAIRIVPRGASEPSGEFARAAGIDVAQVENAASDEAIKTAKEKGLLSGEDFAILESLSAAYPDDDAPKDAYYYEQMDPIIQKGLKYQEKAQELAELKKNIPELFRPDGQFIEKVDPDASYNLIKSGENGGIAIVEFDNFKDGDADGVYFIQNGKLIESPMPILEGIIIATLKYADGDKAISTAAENNLLTDPEKATLESHKDTPKDFSYYKEMASIVEKGLRYQVDPDSASLPTQEDDSDLADPTEEEVPAVISEPASSTVATQQKESLAKNESQQQEMDAAIDTFSLEDEADDEQITPAQPISAEPVAETIPVIEPDPVPEEALLPPSEPANVEPAVAAQPEVVIQKAATPVAAEQPTQEFTPLTAESNDDVSFDASDDDAGWFNLDEEASADVPVEPLAETETAHEWIDAQSNPENLKATIPELFQESGQIIIELVPNAIYKLVERRADGVVLVESDNNRNGVADGVYFVKDGKLIRSDNPILNGEIVATFKYETADAYLKVAQDNNLLNSDELARLQSLEEKYTTVNSRDFAFYQQMASTIEKGLNYHTQEINDLLAKYQERGWVSTSTFLFRELKPNEIAVSMNIRGPDPVFSYGDGVFKPVNYPGSYSDMTPEKFETFIQSADHRPSSQSTA